MNGVSSRSASGPAAVRVCRCAGWPTRSRTVRKRTWENLCGPHRGGGRDVKSVGAVSLQPISQPDARRNTCARQLKQKILKSRLGYFTGQQQVYAIWWKPVHTLVGCLSCLHRGTYETSHVMTTLTIASGYDIPAAGGTR
jgi:hypothetical protein